MPFLELHDAPDSSSARTELGPLTIVGSGSQASWRIARLNLAARHFRISVEPDGRAIIEPATSQNIVMLNEAPVPHGGAELATGDVIAAGSAIFHYVETVGAPRRPVLEPQSGFLLTEDEKSAYTLDRRAVQIGRDIGCHVVVRDPSVSRFHADVRSEAGAYVFYSMGSSGSFVNDQPVSAPRVLQHGDRITIGETVFFFVLGALPTGARRIPFSHERGEDATNRRATQVGVQAVSGGRGGSRRMMPLVLAVVAVIVLAGLYLALR
jgi:pSer/pThr/pTyr-binding forkhead associated (FHA) protein